jgi:TonB family protein
MLQAVFWPNAMLYVIMRELRLVHEFQADAYSATDKQQYMTTLLNGAFGTKRFSFAHTFFHHPLKRRIMMLQKTAPGRNGVRAIALKTCGMAAVLFAGIVWLQSCQQKPEQPKPSSTQEITADDAKAIAQIIDRALDTLGPGARAKDVHAYKDKNGVLKIEINRPAAQNAGTAQDDIVQNADGREIHKTADKMPAPSYDLGQYLSANIKYPEAAKNAKIEGKVIVKFVIDEEGNVRDVTTVTKADADLCAEAMRVVAHMPKWQPGEDKGKKVSVYFDLPIVFRLN